jgi:DNA-directed RNA polymerase subunit M/transcription elongation factor TFIIS
MKFCSQCDNMYYVGVSESDGNKLTYYCRNCGNKDDSAAEEGVCVLNTQLKKGEQKFNHIINQYTKQDPTLPLIYNVKCPNMSCSTNTDTKNGPAEVIYMRYDDDNMKYLYICVTCDTVWKTDDRK